jgi:hypothetical protein
MSEHVINCPTCEKMAVVETEYLPVIACDDLIVRCENCQSDITVGWYAVVEVRGVKPATMKFPDNEDKRFKPLRSGARQTWG